MRVSLPIAIVVTALVAAAGCRPVPAHPSPSPMATCQADGLRVAGPCTGAAFRNQQRETQLREHLRTQIEAFMQEYARLLTAKEAEPSAALKQHADDAYLATYAKELADFHADIRTIDGGKPLLSAATMLFVTDDFALVEVCQDWRSVRYSSGSGQLLLGDIYFRRVGAEWRFSKDTLGETESCLDRS